MRKSMTLLLAAALFVVTGCKKDDKNLNGEKMTFSAGFDNGGAKTEINGLAMSWNQGDAVMINGKTFTADQSGRNTTLSGEKVYQEGGLYKAYFPASMYDNGTLTLPATQTYNGKNLSGVNPMYAQSENTNLTFSNLCAMVKLQLTGSKTVKEIRVSADQPMSGEFEIAEDGSNYKAVMKSQTGKPGVTLNCGTGVNLSENNVFYVALPEGTYTNLKFFVVTTDNMCTSIEVGNATFEANVLRELVREPEFRPYITPSAVTVTGPCVSCAYNVGGTVKVPSGSHACEFGLVYAKTADDATPTIAEGATKIVVHAMGEDAISGTVSFKADLSCLEEGVEYSVRAYALCDEVAYSSEATVMNIIGGNMPKPLPSNWVNGKNPHPFTVAKNKVVYFSQGNLQYLAKGGSAGDASATAASGESVGGTWRFAEHQFDAIGAANDNASSTYSDWIDLFGWATSGYNHNNGRYQPWSKGNGNYYAYGTTASNHLFSQTPAIADWGYNAISNGGGFGWRTPTGDSNGEWNYILTKRDDASQLYGYGKIGNCTKGLIILPDDWICPAGLSFTSGLSDWLNVYSYSDWSKMEAAGAVFLPVFGYRILGFGDEGRSGYWASTYGDGNCACCIFIGNSEFVPNSVHGHGYNQGLYVRLVSDVAPGK